MTTAQKKKYLKEVYYYESDDAVIDIIRLLSGELSIEQLRQSIDDAKVRDEKNYGDTIYKK